VKSTTATTDRPGGPQVRETVARLRESWGWLWLLVVPGPERRRSMAVDDDQAERLEARGFEARAYREWNLRRGLSALPPAAAPARLDVVDAQAAVHRLVTGLARRVAAHLDASYVGGGTEVTAAVVDVLDWLTLGGPGRRIVVDAGGEAWRAGILDDLHDQRDAGLLAHIARTLAAADDLARTAAGVVAEPVRPVEHRCPACRHRSLQLHHAGRDKSAWTVVCVRRSCVCAGAGCGCLRRGRREGLPHVWGRSEMDGPYGLATAVAVAQALAGARPRVGADAAGPGGWPERRRAG
jgi:hypothetical protein